MNPRAITGRIAAWAVNVPIAFTALRTNLMRSILTTLGIMIGVLSVILAVAVGEGTKVSVLDSINAIGSNMAIVFPQPENNGSHARSSGLCPALRRLRRNCAVQFRW
jgi:putative ABC transport system permease protein